MFGRPEGGIVSYNQQMNLEPQGSPSRSRWKESLYRIIFEAETPTGKAFDVALLIFIVISIFAVMFESVRAIRLEYKGILIGIEWFLTIVFTIEYVLRVVCVSRPSKYIFSFFGIIDLLAILPTYLSLIFVNTHYLLVIRAVRLLRVFRVFKMARYVSEAKVLVTALKSSQPKIVAFLVAVLSIVIIMGALMYLIEGDRNGFTSIPQSMYWAIVTLTTVGYGDVVPQTPVGKFLASIVMVMGYAIIAVPTGIVSAELIQAQKISISTRSCKSCTKQGHDFDSTHCRFCGKKL